MVTETAGVVTFSGTATGNITATIDGNGVATFTRGGVTASATVSTLSDNTITIAAGQTLVLTGQQMDLLSVQGVLIKGAGHLWIDARDSGTGVTTDLRFKVVIEMSEGRLTFDMTDDNQDQITLESGSSIDLGGGTLVVSDGTVYAVGVAITNVGRIEINSKLILEVGTLQALDAIPGFTINTQNDGVPGDLEIHVRSQEQLEWVLANIEGLLPTTSATVTSPTLALKLDTQEPWQESSLTALTSQLGEVWVLEDSVDNEATGTLTVKGNAEEGGVLTAALTSVSDVDGSTTTAYQWQEVSSGAGTQVAPYIWSDIVGANAAALSIPSDQSYVGKVVRVVATTTDAQSGTTTFTGEASVVIANVNDAPTGLWRDRHPHGQRQRNG